MISEDVIQKVKEQNDIVDVISETVKLKRSGRYYTGLCPFHHEKTPSFTVTPDKQIYKCFGCGEAGNVISFVMKTRNLSFVEAIEALAERVNITITYTDKKAAVRKSSNDKYIKLNVDAARYFFNNLRKNGNALDYLKRRGISESTIKGFGLGFAKDSWDDIIKYLSSKGYSMLDLLNYGYVLRSEKGTYYDRFRNRIMFPIFDYKGKVIGFGGRVMDDSKPKYLNSPETTVFKKGTNLYGLNFVIKKSREREIIIVEGYMDCISLHQYGIYNVVASLGTALTSNQAKLIKRFADRVIISYDADNAGQNATERGLEILKKEGLDVRILIVPQGKDPDEYVRNNGKEAFLELAHNALPFIDYKLKRLKESFDLSDTVNLAKYAENALDVIIDLDTIERDIYIRKICSETGIKDTALYDLLNAKVQKSTKKAENMNIGNTFGQKLYLEPSYVKAERILLKMMYSNKDTFEYIKNVLDADSFIMESHKKLFNIIFDIMKYDIDIEERKKRIENRCDDIDSTKEWINVEETDVIYDENYILKYIDDNIREIKKNQLEELKKQTMKDIKQLEKQGRIEGLQGLMEKLEKIQKEIGGM